MVDWVLPSAIALSFVFGWNNSSFLIGNMRGSGVLSSRGSVILAALGLLAGVLVGGPQMTKSLEGSVALGVSLTGLFVTFGVSTGLTVAETVLKIPASFSGVMVGSFLGVAVAEGATVNGSRAGLIVSFWFVAPLVAIGLAFAIHRLWRRSTSSLSLIASDTVNRFGVILGSLAVAFVLGANNIGLIAGTSLSGDAGLSVAEVALVMGLATVLGTVLLGKGSVSGTIGDRMLSLSPSGVFAVFASSSILVELGTQFQIPMSISQCVLGGMLGTAYSQETATVNGRLAGESVSTWVIVPLIAFAISYALMRY